MESSLFRLEVVKPTRKTIRDVPREQLIKHSSEMESVVSIRFFSKIPLGWAKVCDQWVLSEMTYVTETWLLTIGLSSSSRSVRGQWRGLRSEFLLGITSKIIESAPDLMSPTWLKESPDRKTQCRCPQYGATRLWTGLFGDPWRSHVQLWTFFD